MRKDISNGIYIAKSTAIVLVIIGHYHPCWPDYWKVLTEFCYTFHVHIFILLAGYLFAKEEIVTTNDYKKLVLNKSVRLLLPYLSVTLIVFLLKAAAAQFVDLDNPINSKTMWHIFVDPRGGFIDILWFLYVLFEIFLIYPIPGFDSHSYTKSRIS